MSEEQFTKHANDRARVLIVDDMPVNRTILSSMLSTLGISCDLAGSGAECLDLCRKNNYDLILLDHRMPDMDGVDTLVELKEIFRKSGFESPVICHTAEEGRGYINLYKAAGFADVLIKPADPGQVMVMLMKYLPDGGFEMPEDEEQKKKNAKELSSLPDWIKQIPMLDLMSGIEHCNTASDYIDALMIFTGSIEEKAADIERFEKDGNWPMYLLKVHSLKSVAGLIGATSLAQAASDLEFAGHREEYGLIHAGTGALLKEYRNMLPQLKRILDGKDMTALVNNSDNEGHKGKQNKHIEQSVMFISDDSGIVGRGITKCLEDEGFTVIPVKDVPEIILNHRGDSDLLLYYPTGDNDHIKLVSTILTEICRDDNKTLCLAGDPLDINVALDIHDKDYISSVYPRPVDLDRMASDMAQYYNVQAEYQRTKTVLVIDDDPDFLAIIDKWLSEQYDVECLRSGESALAYLEHKRPDLILLDLEMPGLNGDQVMKRIRSNPKCERIPIIFLTGKNDKDDVIKILELKPDGYLLKSMPHEVLLDSLDRFFAGSILSGDLS